MCTAETPLRVLVMQTYLRVSTHGLPTVQFAHCVDKCILLQQMAPTAEVLPAERVLRLAQRVQNPPQSRHTDSADCGLHLQEILHRSGESLSICSRASTDSLWSVQCFVPSANPCVCLSAVHWPGAGRQLRRDRGARHARTLL